MAKNNPPLFLYLVLLVVVSLIGFGKVRGTSSDPRAELLVSESILQRGTIQLDHYGPELLQKYGYVIQQKNGHNYYYFPLGTSLVSVPFVAVANAFGIDMVTHEHEAQIAIAAITAVLTVLFLFKLAMLFLPYAESLALAAVFWLGSSFASTTGTALWSHNLASLFALLAIYLAIRSSRNDDFRLYPLVAVSLFFAYLCRPTMALLAPFVLLYVFAYQKKVAVKTAILLALLLGAFAAFSFHEYRQILPDYYLPKRLEGGHFKEALYGNLLSPARGLLVYSPFLLLPLLFIGKFRQLRKDNALLLLIALAWPVAHLIFVSRFPHWWAGWTYGARFMTDALPGLFVLMCCTLSLVRTNRAPAWAFLAVSGCFAIFVNSYQGLYNPYTGQWNAEPNIDKYPEYLFDWKYPPFLHNHERHQSRLREFPQAHLPPGQ